MLRQNPDEVEISLPFFFIVKGTPVSFQADSAKHKSDWKKQVLESARVVIPESKFAIDQEISVTIYDFPEVTPQGDVDNIVKLIQDALCPEIVLNDSSVSRIVAQRFLPDDVVSYADNPPEFVGEALIEDPPFVYVRISGDPLGEAQ